MIQKKFTFKETNAVYLPQVQHVVVNRYLSRFERKELAYYIFESCQVNIPDFAKRWLPAHPDDLIFLTWEISHFSHVVHKTVSRPFRTKSILLSGKGDKKLFHLVTDWLDSLQPNKDNIRKAIEHLRLVKQDDFDMSIYRLTNISKPQQPCGTVACVIGHSTIADENILDFTPVIEHDIWSQIIDFNYHAWSVSFFGVNNLETHDYLFGSDWQSVDNTVESAIKRLELFLEHGNDLMKFVHEQKLPLPW